MTNTTRPRGTRLHIEIDDELTQAIDIVRKELRLSRTNFIRWTLARHILGTASLSALAIEKAGK